MVTVLWLGFGYSWAFDSTGMVEGQVNLRSFVGGFDKALLLGVGRQDVSGTIPEVLFFAFQMTFAIITPALIVGAYPERIHFPAMLLFTQMPPTFIMSS